MAVKNKAEQQFAKYPDISLRSNMHGLRVAGTMKGKELKIDKAKYGDDHRLPQ